MRLLLDTHTFIWYVTDNPRLSANKISFLGGVEGFRNRVFAKYFVVTNRFSKKPGP